MYGKETPTTKEAFYDLVDRDMEGNEVKMSSFKGSVLCITNVASKWGLTKQNYTEFVQIIDEYSDKGLKVLAFPCNQFGGQEPGTHEDIMAFVKTFGADDKMTFFENGPVNGAKSREVFNFLKNKLPSDDGTKDIRWNFAKFLVDHEGQPYKRFGPKTNPLMLKESIEELLKKKGA